MKRLKKFGLILTLFAVMISYLSCTKEYMSFDKMKQPDWNPTFGTPVINTSFYPEDIFNVGNNNYVQTDANGFVYLVYTDTLISEMAKDIFSIGDQTVSLDRINFPDGPIPNGTTQTITIDTTLDFTGLGSMQIDSILLKLGNLQYNFTASSGYANIVFNLTIPSITDGGSPVTINETITPSNTTISQTTSLSGHKIDLTNGSGNSIEVQGTITLTFNGTPLLNDYLDISFSVAGIEFSMLYGDLGQQLISNTQTVEINVDLFNNATDGTVSFADPKVKFNIYNYFGFPISLDFQQLYVYATKTSTNMDLLSDLDNNPMILDYPNISQVQSRIGKLTSDSLSGIIDPNFKSAIENLPKSLTYVIDATSNPLSEPSSVNQDAVADSSRFEVHAQVSVPLWGRATGLQLADTFNFTFQSFDAVESGVFKIYAENNFPIDVSLMLLFVDSNYATVDTLLDGQENAVTAAAVKSDGTVESPTTKLTEVIISPEKIKRLKNVSYVILRAELQTANYTLDPDEDVDVKLYLSQFLKIKLGVIATIGNIDFGGDEGDNQ